MARHWKSYVAISLLQRLSILVSLASWCITIKTQLGSFFLCHTFSTTLSSVLSRLTYCSKSNTLHFMKCEFLIIVSWLNYWISLGKRLRYCRSIPVLKFSNSVYVYCFISRVNNVFYQNLQFQLHSIWYNPRTFDLDRMLIKEKKKSLQWLSKTLGQLNPYEIIV